MGKKPNTSYVRKTKHMVLGQFYKDIKLSDSSTICSSSSKSVFRVLHVYLKCMRTLVSSSCLQFPSCVPYVLVLVRSLPVLYPTMECLVLINWDSLHFDRSKSIALFPWAKSWHYWASFKFTTAKSYGSSFKTNITASFSFVLAACTSPADKVAPDFTVLFHS